MLICICTALLTLSACATGQASGMFNDDTTRYAEVEIGEMPGGGSVRPVPRPSPVCGNDVSETGEQCDGNDLNGLTCESFNYTGGNLSCTENCTWDTSNCYKPFCGDGDCNGNETYSSCPEDCDAPADSCTDSDGGQVFDVYGTAEGYRNGEFYVFADECNPVGRLKEQYCSGDSRQEEYFECLCEDGVCTEYCGDGECNYNETSVTCPSDCGNSSGGNQTGNNS